MQWIKKNLTLAVVLSLLVIGASALTAFTTLQVQAGEHLDRQELSQEYVPRPEVDARDEAFQEKLDLIHEDVKENQRLLIDHLID